jgi:membrane associated rhomboid family serine protease
MFFSNQHNTRSGSAVVNLIIINVIVFVAMNLLENMRNNPNAGVLDQYLPLWNPFDPRNDNFKIWQPVTSMFVHADFMHLLFNMIGLFFFGRMLEQAFGTKRFLIYYFVCGIGASLIYIAWAVFSYYRDLSHGDIFEAFTNFSPCVGASGAVFGLLMGAAMLFPNTQFLIYGIIPMRLGVMALLYGTYELFMIIRDLPQDRVAHIAHVGGLIFGFIMLKIYQRNKRTFY